MLNLTELWEDIANDTDSCFDLNLNGININAFLNTAHAIRYDHWVRAADLGLPSAQWLLGKCYEKGLSVACDNQKAFELYLKAAEKGNPAAQNIVATCYYQGIGVEVDYTAAFCWFKKSAEQGYPAALYNMGVCLDQGIGTPKDNQVAAECLYNASAQGYRPACDITNEWKIIGLYSPKVLQNQEPNANEYITSQTFSKQAYDNAERIQWYFELANKGYSVAQFNLGVSYANGQGVEKDDAEAVRWYRKAAEQGHVTAQFNLGVHYDNGQGVEKNQAEAAKWYRMAAEQGHVTAQYDLGVRYDIGLGVEKNQAEAAKWYRKAAEQGYVNAQYTIGFCYANGQGVEEDEAEAVRWYRMAAEQGDVNAQYNLGVRYANGRGVERDEAEAAKWYRKAAEQGDVSAQFSMGHRYANGQGVEEDQAEAVRWYRKAAEQGHVTAQFNLGVRYANGQGVEKDQAEAVRWYRKAAEQGDVASQFNLAVHYDNGQGVEKDEAEAARWYRKAAEQGDVDAQCNLGVHYANGQGVEKDEAEAVRWYRKAAEQGDATAQFNLGFCYLDGQGVEEDGAEAVRWFKKAAEQGHVDAQCIMGIHYRVVEKDEAESAKWDRKAAEQGHAGAQHILGNRYKAGLGVEKDLTLAVHWFSLAAGQNHVDAQVELAFCYRMGIGVESDDAEAVYWYQKAAEQGNEIAKKNLDVIFGRENSSPEIQSTSKDLEPNADQKIIIQHLEGPLFVHAPAGSGKTLLLALRAEQALLAGFKPAEILCITFTNLAARHLRQRVEQNAPAQAQHIWMSTFHGFCASFLRMEAKHAGLPADFVILDEEDCKSLLTKIIDVQEVDKSIKPSALLVAFDKAKAKADQRSLSLQGYDGQGLATPIIQQIYKAYSKDLADRHALDFSDLIYYVRAILANIPEIKQKWAQRFKFIQVDEIQDTHMAEYDVIRTLASSNNIAAFGDLDQSIYGWRGAEPAKVRNRFIKDFSPQIFSLPYNYRATKTLIHAAESFALKAFEDRHNKLIPDQSCPEGDAIVVHHASNEGGEATWIEEKINFLTSEREQQFKDIAVICRTNQKAIQIASDLEAQDIPCLTVDQYHFFRRQEIKDALAVLRLLINPHDVSSAHRISMRFVKGVGKATVGRILNEGSDIGIRLTDFFNKQTFEYNEPFGRLIQAYDQGLLTVIDAETTGINPIADNIIELAHCTLDAGHTIQQWSSLIRSDKLVGSSVHVHGITDEQLKNEGIPPEDGLSELFRRISSSLVVGHNVSFDIATIRSQAGRVGLGIPEPFFNAQFSVDTCEIARRFLDVKSYRLEDLCIELNLSCGSAHRAMEDVENTIKLLKHLMPYVRLHQDKRVEFIQRYRHFFEPVANIFSTVNELAHNERPFEVLNKALDLFNLMDFYEQEPKRIANLNSLVSLFREQDRKNFSPWNSLHTLVQFASLSKSLDHLSENENKVIVAPIHQSKGLEFSSVFIAGAVDGFIPHFRAEDIEEEKRLFYVAMTRPKENLYITGAKEYVTNRGNVIQKNMTPFLDYIEDKLLNLKESMLTELRTNQDYSATKTKDDAFQYDNVFGPKMAPNSRRDTTTSPSSKKDPPDNTQKSHSLNELNPQSNKTEKTKNDSDREYLSATGSISAVLGYMIGFWVTGGSPISFAFFAIGYIVGHLFRKSWP